MSSVVDEKKKTKTKTMGRYTLALEYPNPATSESILETFAFESTSNIEDTMNGILGWFLTFRSKFFPSLKYDDITTIKDEAFFESIPIPETSPAIACHQVAFPFEGKEITLKVTFSNFNHLTVMG